jgi:hypothetical protein
MRPNNRQRSRGGRSGGGGGNHNQHKQQHNHNPNRPPNRNQIFDSSGPDVRVRGNAHQVFDKYQALAREAASSGDRIQAEAYWQYADHYFRVIQSQGGFVPRSNQGWGDGGEDGQPQNPNQEGQSGQPQANGTQGGANGGTNGSGPDAGYPSNDRQHDGRQNEGRQSDGRQNEPRQNDGRQGEGRQNDNRQSDNRQGDNRSDDRGASRAESEPGLGGVAFLQSGRSAPSNQDPAAEDQPEVPEFRPSGRRGS